MIIGRYYPDYEILFKIDDTELTKSVLRNSIIYYVGDQIDYWNDVVTEWLSTNVLGLIFLDFIEDADKFKIGFERKEDLAMFTLRFKNENVEED